MPPDSLRPQLRIPLACWADARLAELAHLTGSGKIAALDGATLRRAADARGALVHQTKRGLSNQAAASTFAILREWVACGSIVTWAV